VFCLSADKLRSFIFFWNLDFQYFSLTFYIFFMDVSMPGLTNICRLCAIESSTSHLFDIYSAEGTNLQIEDKIVNCLRIEVLTYVFIYPTFKLAYIAQYTCP